MKPDESIRICGDYETTINRVSELDNYPISKVKDLLVSLEMETTSRSSDPESKWPPNVD